MLRIGTNSNAFLSSRPSISSFMASWVLCEVHLRSDFNRTSLSSVWCTFEVVLGYFIVSLSGLKSGLLSKGSIGRMEVMLHSFISVPSVIDVIFSVLFVPLKGPSHFPVHSRKTRPLSHGCMWSFVAGVSLDVMVFLIRFSAKMRSISARAVFGRLIVLFGLAS